MINKPANNPEIKLNKEWILVFMVVFSKASTIIGLKKDE